jgi:hypothetical protein
LIASPFSHTSAAARGSLIGVPVLASLPSMGEVPATITRWSRL